MITILNFAKDVTKPEDTWRRLEPTGIGGWIFDASCPEDALRDIHCVAVYGDARRKLLTSLLPDCQARDEHMIRALLTGDHARVKEVARLTKLLDDTQDRLDHMTADLRERQEAAEE